MSAELLELLKYHGWGDPFGTVIDGWTYMAPYRDDPTPADTMVKILRLADYEVRPNRKTHPTRFYLKTHEPWNH